MINKFLFSYDPIASMGLSSQLLSLIKESRSISGWIKPYEGLYILKSHQNQNQLQAIFSDFFENKVLFVVAELNSISATGVLPAELWRWVNDNPFAGLFDQSGS